MNIHITEGALISGLEVPAFKDIISLMSLFHLFSLPTFTKNKSTLLLFYLTRVFIIRPMRLPLLYLI